MDRVRRAGGAVVAQGTAAAASLVLQVVVARTLGASGFGSYQLLLGALVLVTALQTAMIGDTLTVLGRADPHVRGALVLAQAAFLLIGAGVAGVVAWTTDAGGASVAAAFALATVGWLLEDTGRRLFMVRVRFWALVVNDLVYFTVAVATLGLLASRPGEISLVDVLLATAAGAFVAAAAATIQLPREDFRGGPVTTAGVAQVLSFGGWRSAQAGLRPLAGFATRIAVAGVAGTAALGQLQAARLLLAPMFTALAGFGSFLLPTYKRQPARQGWTTRRSLAQQTAALVGIVTFYTAVVIALQGPLTQMLFGDTLEVDILAIVAWGTTAIAFAAGLPVMTAALVRREVRRVFVIRACDVLLGIPMVALLLVVATPSSAPFGTAIGMLLAVVLLWRDAAGPRGRGRAATTGDGNASQPPLRDPVGQESRPLPGKTAAADDDVVVHRRRDKADAPRQAPFRPWLRGFHSKSPGRMT